MNINLSSFLCNELIEVIIIQLFAYNSSKPYTKLYLAELSTHFLFFQLAKPNKVRTNKLCTPAAITSVL